MNFQSVSQPISTDYGESARVLRVLSVAEDGNPVAGAAVPSEANITSVTASTSSVTLLVANADRLAVSIVNDSTTILYIKCGTAASSTSYTVKMAAGDYWEMPTPIWPGIVTGIWASVDGAARITEFE